MNIDELLDKAEELGWCIHESDTEWEFIQNSPAGEDFSFYISASDVRNAGDMVHEIRSYANGFDEEEHAKMWIEAQGESLWRSRRQDAHKGRGCYQADAEQAGFRTGGCAGRQA